MGWCSQQAALCSEEKVVYSGISSAQIRIAYGQRGVKGQPFGGSCMSGGEPGIGISSWLRSAVGSGMEARRPQV
jgi:hypothetical protein